jgi:tetratricopeptide (TPR) repeat protein
MTGSATSSGGAPRVRLALAGLDGRSLLVWDNAEDVWEDKAMRGFVNQLPGECQALLTTRRDPEQAMWPTIELRPLPDETMAQLFARLAGSARMKVADPADYNLILPIVDWLQGHPLALNLVIRLLRTRSLRRVWADLRKRPLKGIAAAFSASYGRLTTVQKQLFTRLSVFTIPFEWTAAEALLPGAKEVEEALDVLVQRALLAFDGRRHAYHALLRQYAYEELERREDVRPVHRLAAEYLQVKLTSEGGTPAEGLEEVDQWQKAEEWEQFALSASALVGDLDRLGYWSEIRERLERARTAVQTHLDARADLDADLLNKTAIIAHKSADWDEAIALWEGAAGQYEAAGNAIGQAGVLGNLGNVYTDKGEWNRAIEFYQKALQTMERLGDPRGMAYSYNNLGIIYRVKGEWDRAIEFHRKALQIRERLGGPREMAPILSNLGLVYADKGEWDRAIEFYQESLEIMEQVGDAHGMAQTYTNLGLVYADKGEWDRAIEFYQESLETMKQVGDPHGMSATLDNLGSVYRLKGEWERAIELFEKSLRTRERLGDVHGLAGTYNNLGNVYMRQREWDQAIEFHRKSLQTKERLGDVHGIAQTNNNLGIIYGQKGEWDRAIELYRKSLQTKERLGDVHGMAQTYTNLGSVYRSQGDLERAARYTVQAYLIFVRLGAAEAHQAANQLVDILGSKEAAEAYLKQLLEERRKEARPAHSMRPVANAPPWPPFV